MPKGPRGEKRPADGIGNAVPVTRIAIGEVEKAFPPDDGKDKAAQEAMHDLTKARLESGVTIARDVQPRAA